MDIKDLPVAADFPGETAEGARMLLAIREGLAAPLESLSVLTEEDAEVPDMGKQFGALAWYLRLIYLVLGFFTNRTAEALFRERQMVGMGRGVEVDFPGVYDSRQRMLRQAFYDRLLRLKEAGRFLYDLMSGGLGRERPAFFAVLGSLEMRGVHCRLKEECRPEAVMARKPDLPPAGLRHQASRTLDEILYSIPEEARDTMYYHARSFGHIVNIACFLFDRLLLAFTDTPEGKVCRINAAVKDQLMALDAVFLALREPPTSVFIEALLLYQMERGTKGPLFDADTELTFLLNRMDGSLRAIADFGGLIPLGRILRCATGNPEYAPAPLGGGEDWFQLYRCHWEQRIQADLSRFLTERKCREIAASLEVLYGIRLVPAPGQGSSGIPLAQDFALSFLAAFHPVLAGKMGEELAPFLTETDDGPEADDPNEVAGPYRRLLDIERDIRDFYTKLGPRGVYGGCIRSTGEEAEAPAAKARKVKAVQEHVGEEAAGIILGALQSMRKLTAALDALSAEDPGLAERTAGTREGLRYAVTTLEEVGESV